MSRRKDIANVRFGMLVAIEYSHSVNGKALWHCVCDCGTKKQVYLQSLMNGDATSCSCKRWAAKDPVKRILESSKVNEETGCWEWQLSKDSGGYGRLKVQMGARDKFRFDGAHRYAYSVFKGEIPSGLEVCHSCDNRCCVNPEHLWLGTHQQNMQDMHRKGRWSMRKPKVAMAKEGGANG